MLNRSSKLTAGIVLLFAPLVLNAESQSDHEQPGAEEIEPGSQINDRKVDRTQLHYDLNLHEDRRRNRLRLEVPVEVPATESERSRLMQERAHEMTPEAPESPEAPQSPDIP